jgi:hypothetical protein
MRFDPAIRFYGAHSYDLGTCPVPNSYRRILEEQENTRRDEEIANEYSSHCSMVQMYGRLHCAASRKA